jgi:membrane glycosyltransferase
MGQTPVAQQVNATANGASCSMTEHPDVPLTAEVLMPARAPLAMPTQDFFKRLDPSSAGSCQPMDDAVRAKRWVVFGSTGLLTVLIAGLQLLWLREGGLSLPEAGLIAAVSATLAWTVLTCVTGLAGLLRRAPSQPLAGIASLRVAVLVTLHEEDLDRIERNLAAMLASLGQQHGRHAVDIFVLSDTQSLQLSLDELALVGRLRAQASTRLFYRRRTERKDHKAGNIRDWVSGWGGAYDVMVPLDADSVMSGAAIAQLVDHLAADPRLGIVQSWPRLIAARSLVARLQAVGTDLFGQLTACGYASWSGASATYWGHNAAIRVPAFAAHCGLPPGYLSHDSVEAMAMRRAGWGVAFLPDRLESHEEAPPDLASFLQRDWRWCAGNLQHMLILAPGLPLLVRFNLLHGAATYLSSLARWSFGVGPDAIWRFLPSVARCLGPS